MLLASEVYFYTVIYNELFLLLCAKTNALDTKLNASVLTIQSFKKYEIRPDLKAALEGSKANLTMLSYLTNPRYVCTYVKA